LGPGVRLLMDDQSQGPRWRELDAIRGIAACIVVLWHFYQALSPESFPTWIRWGMERTPLYLFISGTESVLLFFLLSGFVLSLPFHRHPDHLGYRAFVVKRIARIYIPYLAALLLAVAGNAFYHGLPLNSWFTETWGKPVDWTTFFQHVLFLGNYDYYAFNTAFWSLVYEMRISLIFPALCLFVIRIGWSRSILLAIGFAISSVFLRLGGVPGQTAETFKYVSFFVVGILLAQFASRIREFVSRIPNHLRVAGILLSLLGYALGHLFPSAIKDTLILIGASGIIVAGITEPRLCQILRWPLFQFLGRISYSIYLLHGTILFLLVYLFYQRVPLTWLFLPLLAFVLAASILFYHLIERPSIKLGRQLAKRFQTREDSSRIGSTGDSFDPAGSNATILVEPGRDLNRDHVL